MSGKFSRREMESHVDYHFFTCIWRKRYRIWGNYIKCDCFMRWFELCKDMTRMRQYGFLRFFVCFWFSLFFLVAFRPQKTHTCLQKICWTSEVNFFFHVFTFDLSLSLLLLSVCLPPSTFDAAIYMKMSSEIIAVNCIENKIINVQRTVRAATFHLNKWIYLRADTIDLKV